MPDEIFESAVRSSGDLAGVFEYDGEVGHFYLFAVHGDADYKILSAIQTVSGTADFTARDIEIQWDDSEVHVGLFIRNTLWAVFDTVNGTAHGGNYSAGSVPEIPSRESFQKRPRIN